MANTTVWECIICGFVYNEAEGLPDEGIAPGTAWADVPEDWLCPECGVGKADFEMIEVTAATSVTSTSACVSADITPSLQTSSSPQGNAITYKIWECIICGWEYDELKGCPEEGIPPGTPWEDVPEDFICPDCGVGKADFEMIAIHEYSAEAAEPTAPQPTIAVRTVDYQLEPIVIIGSGLAGYNLARSFRALNNTRPLIMLTRDDGAFYSKPALSTGFQKNKSAQSLMSQDAEQMAHELQLDIRLFCDVSNIDREQRVIQTNQGTLRYHHLVLATGSSCIKIPTAGNAADQVLHINTLQDYAAFRTAAVGKRHITIIGAGLIGSEFCNDLSLAGYAVDIIDPMPNLLASLIPTAAAQRVQNGLSNEHVNFHFGTTVAELSQMVGATQVTLDNGKQFTTDLVLSAVGVRANTALAKQIGLAVNRGIFTDEYCRTSDANIFALGDCAEVNGDLRYYVAPLMLCAKALAQTLDGTPTAVHYDTMPIAIKTTQHPVLCVPVTPGTEGSWHIDTDDADGVAARFVTSTGAIVGFALTGSEVAKKDQYTAMLRSL